MNDDVGVVKRCASIDWNGHDIEKFGIAVLNEGKPANPGKIELPQLQHIHDFTVGPPAYKLDRPLHFRAQILRPAIEKAQILAHDNGRQTKADGIFRGFVIGAKGMRRTGKDQ